MFFPFLQKKNTDGYRNTVDFDKISKSFASDREAMRDDVRDIVEEALNERARWSDKWYFQILTHGIAFGLGILLEHYRLGPKIETMQNALQELQRRG